jgi:P2 family phage contractile tail tube protein
MSISYALENATVWLNGNTLAGHVSEIELPELNFQTIDREALGDIGILQLPTRLEELECTLTWTDWNPELAIAACNPWAVAKIQVRGNVAEHSPQGKVADSLLKVDITGRFLQNQMGTISPNEALDVQTMMSCIYVKQTWKGATILEVDIQTPTYRVNGVDRLQAMRANMGR